MDGLYSRSDNMAGQSVSLHSICIYGLQSKDLTFRLLASKWMVKEEVQLKVQILCTKPYFIDSHDHLISSILNHPPAETGGPLIPLVGN